MAAAHFQGRYDPLLDWLGAGFPAACAGYAAIKLGPLFGAPAWQSAVGAAASMFVIAYAVMRAVRSEPPIFTIFAHIDHGQTNDELLLEQKWQDVAVELDELLLDRPLVEERTAELAELLLDDALAAPEPHSRVVQLFAPTQLKERIDRHLANARSTDSANRGDASDALSEALAELKLSLHRA